jgi:hypothetical protein
MLPLPTRACVADPGVRIGAAMPSDGDARTTGLTGRVASAAPMFIATGTQGSYKLLPAQDRNPPCMRACYLTAVARRGVVLAFGWNNLRS